jgi:hypothetical protein
MLIYGQHSQPMNTASPSVSVGSDIGVKTRSGRRVGRGDSVTQPQLEHKPSAAKPRSPKPTKKKSAKDRAKDLSLKEPISVFTKDIDVPIKDMEAWVHRSTEVRMKEVEDGNGKIPRPMNSFMLYRSAYADRLKAWGQHNNHQEVSKFAGASWQIEPEELKDRYKDLAKVERENHQRAHPDYKFSPSKAGTIRKRGSPDDESEEDDGPNDYDDPDAEWAPGGRRTRNKRQRIAVESHANTISPYDAGIGLHPGHWSLPTYDVKPLPQSIPLMDPYVQYQQHYAPQPVATQYSMPGLHDMHSQQYRRVSHTSAMPYNMHMPAQPLVGLPTHHSDLLQLGPIAGTPPPSREVGFDPSIMGFDTGFVEQAEYVPPIGQEHHFARGFFGEDILDPDLGGPLDTGTEFEKWMNEEEGHM